MMQGGNATMQRADWRFELQDRINATRIYTKMLSLATQRQSVAIQDCIQMVKRAERRLAQLARKHRNELSEQESELVATTRLFAQVAILKAQEVLKHGR